MENIEELLSQDDILSRVYQYELDREEGRIFINIRELLNGSKKGMFYAYPSLFIQECNNTEYIGSGDSAEEALKDCLKKIKDIPIRQIMLEEKVR